VSESEITEHAVGAAIKVHKALGPGLLESAYKSCLFYEIKKSGLFVEREKAVPLIYAEAKLDCGLRTDLVIENKVIVDVKAVDSFSEIHLKQTTNLSLLDVRVGLLMNFNVLRLKAGLKRVVNDFREGQ